MNPLYHALNLMSFTPFALFNDIHVYHEQHYRSRCHGKVRLNDVSKRRRHPGCCFALWSNSTRGVRAYALNSDLEHGRGMRVVRAML